MKILFHLPAPNTIYAGRTIAQGYKHAFQDLGHEFSFLTPSDDQSKVFAKNRPDIFFVGIGPFTFRYLDLEAVKAAKRQGTKVFVNTPFWNSPLASNRINEVPSLSQNKNWISLIQSGDFGDCYFNICEQGDDRMAGFERITGYKPETILLAADKILLFPEVDQKFVADISYIGTYLPEKREFIRNSVFPLRAKYDLRLYGQDWTWLDRSLGFSQKVGQYFNIPGLRSLQRPKLKLEDERKIYSSSKVCINIHEDYQKKYGDINERTFKIPCAGGFEIVDDVPTLNKYFKPDTELVIAHNQDDWFDKIDYYMKRPKERQMVIEAGRKRVLQAHTYHHRVKQILGIYKGL